MDQGQESQQVNSISPHLHPTDTVIANDYSLPPCQPVSEPRFTWGEVDGESFADQLVACYKEVVHWRRNVFKIPSGKAGKDFVKELVNLLKAFTDRSTLESVALRAAMVMPSLLLQKASRTSKPKDCVNQLKRRMIDWKKGNISALLHEGRTIQKRLPSMGHGAMPENTLVRTFTQLMAKGKVKDALRVLSQQAKGRVLPLDEAVPGSPNRTVRQVLEEKLPPAKPLCPSAVEEVSTLPDTHHVIFDRVDGELVRRVTLKMDGAAGPSGLDAADWKRLCTSFQADSIDLCDSVACLARRLATEYVDPTAVAHLSWLVG